MLVAARMRTSTFSTERLPRRENCWSWRTCRSLACNDGGISPISSSRIVPLLQISNLPGLAWVAPVNAPASYPNSSLSSKSAGTAAQFTFKNVRCARGESLWIKRAITSLPVPLSPNIRTGMSTCATSAACERSLRMFAQAATKKVSSPRSSTSPA